MKYSLSIRLIHWIMAVLIIGMLTSGFTMPDMANDNPLKWQIYDIHKSTGICILALLATRIFLRVSSPTPNLPEEISRDEALLSRVVVFMLYACMLLMPLSGYVMSDAAGFRVELFGLSIPQIFPFLPKLASIARSIHGWIAYLMTLFILLHILWVIKHMLMDKVNLLKRII